MSELGEGFFIGVIWTCSLLAGFFFLRFWRRTKDFLFMAFGVAFLVEAVNRMAVLLLPRPNEGTPTIYVVRLLMSLLILGAIVKKNLEAGRRG